VDAVSYQNQLPASESLDEYNRKLFNNKYKAGACLIKGGGDVGDTFWMEDEVKVEWEESALDVDSIFGEI
jgi:hypothetical protein